MDDISFKCVGNLMGLSLEQEQQMPIDLNVDWIELLCYEIISSRQ